MAMAAHVDRRTGRQVAAGGCGRDRFDILLTEPDRMSPALVAQSLPQIDEATRDKHEVAAEQRRRACSGHGSEARSCWGRQSVIKPTPAPTETAGHRDAGRGSDAIPVQIRRPLAQHSGAGSSCGRARQRSPSSGTRWRRETRSDDHRGRAARIVPALTIEMLRVATGAGALLINTDKRRAFSAVAIQGFRCRSRPTRTVSSGSISRRTIRHASSPAMNVKDGNFPADRFQGRSFCSARRPPACSTSKRRRSKCDMPGVEVHAQILENIFTQSLLSRPDYADRRRTSADRAAFGHLYRHPGPPDGRDDIARARALRSRQRCAAGSWYFYRAARPAVRHLRFR